MLGVFCDTSEGQDLAFIEEGCRFLQRGQGVLVPAILVVN